MAGDAILSIILRAKDEATAVIQKAEGSLSKSKMAMAAVGAAAGLMSSAAVGALSDMAREGAEDEATWTALTTAAENAAARHDEIAASLAENESSLATLQSNIQATSDSWMQHTGQLQAAKEQLASMTGTDKATADAKKALKAEITELEAQIKAESDAYGTASDEADKLTETIAKQQSQVASTGVEFDTAADEMDAYIAKMGELAVDDGELKTSLANLVATTGDYQKSMELASLASDIARGKNISLEAATSLVGKVYEGNTSSLARYGIQLEEGATSQEALAELQKRFAGQTEAYANTTQGQMDKLAISLGNQREQIGQMLGPYQQWIGMLPGVSSGVTMVSGAIGALSGAQVTAKASQLAHSAAQIAGQAATSGMTAVQWALNAAMSANPIMLVVVALAALAAGLVYAYQNSEEFRAIVDAVFAALGSVVQAGIQIATDAINGAGQLITDLGTSWQEGWDALGKIVDGGVQGVQDLINGLLTFFTDVVSGKFLSQAKEWGGNLITGLVEGLATLGADLMKAIGDAISSIKIDIGPFHLDSTGFRIDAPTLPSISMPSLPGYATGGVVPGPRGAPQLAIVHGGETIIPAGETAQMSGLTPVGQGGAGGTDRLEQKIDALIRVLSENAVTPVQVGALVLGDQDKERMLDWIMNRIQQKQRQYA